MGKDIEFYVGKSEVVEKGGPGSGHWGHKGRKGKRGGSAPRRGAKLGSSPVSSVVSRMGKGQIGANESILISFEDGSEAIFKPNDEEMEYGSANSEVLAYELSQDLGWDIVPETVPYEFEEKSGSLQRWVPNSRTWQETGKSWEDTSDTKRFAQMKVLDALLGNTDRHPGNVLEDKSGKVWAIDNGGAFGQKWKQETGRYISYTKSSVRNLMKAANIDFSPELKGLCKETCRDLGVWREAQGKRKVQYRDKVHGTFGPDASRAFGVNLDELVEWGGK